MPSLGTLGVPQVLVLTEGKEVTKRTIIKSPHGRVFVGKFLPPLHGTRQKAWSHGPSTIRFGNLDKNIQNLCPRNDTIVLNLTLQQSTAGSLDGQNHGVGERFPRVLACERRPLHVPHTQIFEDNNERQLRRTPKDWPQEKRDGFGQG